MSAFRCPTLMRYLPRLGTILHGFESEISKQFCTQTLDFKPLSLPPLQVSGSKIMTLIYPMWLAVHLFNSIIRPLCQCMLCLNLRSALHSISAAVASSTVAATVSASTPVASTIVTARLAVSIRTSSPPFTISSLWDALFIVLILWDQFYKQHREANFENLLQLTHILAAMDPNTNFVHKFSLCYVK